MKPAFIGGEHYLAQLLHQGWNLQRQDIKLAKTVLQLCYMQIIKVFSSTMGVANRPSCFINGYCHFYKNWFTYSCLLLKLINDCVRPVLFILDNISSHSLTVLQNDSEIIEVLFLSPNVTAILLLVTNGSINESLKRYIVRIYQGVCYLSIIMAQKSYGFIKSLNLIDYIYILGETWKK